MHPLHSRVRAPPPPSGAQFNSLTQRPSDEDGYTVPLMDCVIAKFLHADEDADDEDDPFDYIMVNTMLRS